MVFSAKATQNFERVVSATHRNGKHFDIIFQKPVSSKKYDIVRCKRDVNVYIAMTGWYNIKAHTERMVVT